MFAWKISGRRCGDRGWSREEGKVGCEMEWHDVVLIGGQGGDGPATDRCR